MDHFAEQQRIDTLNEYQVLDTAPEEYFDHITQSAALAANMPVAFISFIDEKRQWFKSKWGFNYPELPREMTFCNLLLTESLDVLIVNDVSKDSRFKDNPSLNTDFPILCCVSVPLKSKNGQVLGSLCVVDRQPGKITPALVNCLQLLARLVEDKLEAKKDAATEVISKERQDLVNSALDASIDHIYIIDPLNMQFLECNEAAARDMHYSRNELLMMGPQDISPALTRAQLYEKYEAVLASPEGSGSLITLHRTKTGKLLDVKIYLKKFTSVFGKIILVATVRDITMEKKVQQALQESEQQYRSLFEFLPNLVMRTDLDGKILLASNSSFGLLGYLPQELLGRNMAEIYLFKNLGKVFLKQLSITGDIKKFPTELKRKDDKVKTCSIDARYYHNAHNEIEGIEAVITDMSDMIESQANNSRTKSFYEQILHSIGADIAVLDQENRYCFLNRHILPDDIMRAQFIGKTNLEYCQDRNLPVDIAAERQRLLDRVSFDENHIQSIEKLEAGAETKYKQRQLSLFMADDNEIYKVRYGIDITELKRTEIQLAHNESYLKSLINSIPDAIYTLDALGRFTENQHNLGSPAAFASHELLGKTVHEILGKAIGDLHVKNIERALQENKTISFEFYRDDEQNGRRFFESRMTPISGREIVSAVRDISDRKAHDQEICSYTQLLVEREENLASIIEAGPDSVIVVDDNGKITLWNSKSEAIFGWRAEEALGKSLVELLIPEYYQADFNTGMMLLMQSGLPLPVDIPSQFKGVTRSGDSIYVEATISTFKQNGKVSFIGFLRDISDKKKADQQLKYRTQQLLSAQQIAQLASYAIDLEKGEIELSDTINDILGTDPGVPIQQVQQFLQFVHPEDQEIFTERLINMVEDPRVNSIEYRVITRTGNIKYVSDSYHYIEQKQKRCFGTIQDITERKMFDRKLFDAIIESEERERSRIAGELHDGACQYMASAKMSIESAKKLYPKEPGLAQELMENGILQIMEAVELTRKLSHDLVPAPLNKIELNKALDQLVESLNKQDDIFYTFYSSGAKRPIENNITTNLFRIVQEFIRNSQKHSKAQEVIMDLNFLEDSIEFSITDNGIGFDMKKLRPEGIGILNIIKRVETIGGKYNYQAKEGEGVKLWIRLTGL